MCFGVWLPSTDFDVLSFCFCPVEKLCHNLNHFYSTVRKDTFLKYLKKYRVVTLQHLILRSEGFNEEIRITYNWQTV